MTAFAIRDLRYDIAGRRLLTIDRLQIEAGQLTLLLGSNGAGKTTLLRCLAGLLQPEGSILFAGQNLAAMERRLRARAIAWVPSSMQVSFDLTVEELVLEGRFPWHAGYPRAEDRRQAAAALDELGIRSLGKRLLSTLSSGEQQKVQLARAIACEVSCLLLDEPCAHLDVKARFEMVDLLKALVGSGRTVVMSSHDLYTIPRFATRTLALKGGSVFAARKGPLTPEDLATLYDLESRQFAELRSLPPLS